MHIHTHPHRDGKKEEGEDIYFTILLPVSAPENDKSQNKNTKWCVKMPNRQYYQSPTC